MSAAALAQADEIPVHLRRPVALQDQHCQPRGMLPLNTLVAWARCRLV
jgi:hypothetical protein